MTNQLGSNPSASDFTRFLFNEQRRLVKAGWGFVAMYLFLGTAPYIYLDLYAYDEDGLYSILNLVTWALGYLLFLGLMRNGGYLDQGQKSGVGTYFVLGIAIGIPVSIGLVILVIPGLYLLMRLLPAYCRSISTGDWIGNCLRWSWTETEALQKPLSIGVVLAVLGYCASLLLYFLYDEYYQHFGWFTYIILTLIANIMMSIGIVCLTLFAIASYGMIMARRSQFAGEGG